MGISKLPDILQDKINVLLQGLECIVLYRKGNTPGHWLQQKLVPIYKLEDDLLG